VNSLLVHKINDMFMLKKLNVCTVGQVRVCNISYVLDRVNRCEKPLRSTARGASFHTKHASNANVVPVVLLKANSYLALCAGIELTTSYAIQPTVSTRLSFIYPQNNAVRIKHVYKEI
jgi:hypothetical protein